MPKLSHLVAGEWLEHSHAAVYSTEAMADGTSRLAVGIPGSDPLVFSRLVGSLRPPIILLYVLHTPRGEGMPGRYQSPPLGQPELVALLRRFSSFLSGDARFDLWGRSHNDNATVVWDRHNKVYASGPLNRFAKVLRELGFGEGDAEIPVPHMHHYRAEFDGDAATFLRALAWTHSPLRPEDEQ